MKRVLARNSWGFFLWFSTHIVLWKFPVIINKTWDHEKWPVQIGVSTIPNAPVSKICFGGPRRIIERQIKEITICLFFVWIPWRREIFCLRNMRWDGSWAKELLPRCAKLTPFFFFFFFFFNKIVSHVSIFHPSLNNKEKIIHASIQC